MILYHRATCILQQVLPIVVDSFLAVVVVVFGGFVPCEGKLLNMGNDSQEMPQSDNYNCFLKNNLH